MKPARQFGLRTRLIVDRGLQFNLVTRMVLFVLLVCCLVLALLFSPLVRQATGGTAPNPRALAEALLYLQGRFWIVALVCLVVAVAGAVLTSHRIAGPLVRIRRLLRIVTEGHFPDPLQIRPGDFFEHEVTVLNDMVSGLASRIEELKAAEAGLAEAIEDHARRLDTGDAAAIRASAERVATCAAWLRELLAGFSSDHDPAQCAAATAAAPEPVAAAANPVSSLASGA